MISQEHINIFFDSIASWGEAIGDPSLTFAAVKSGKDFEITQARLLVGTNGPFTPFGYFSSSRVRAGHFPLRQVELSPRQYVDKVLSGVCPTPWGEVLFSGNETGQYSSSHQQFHPDGVARGERIEVLSLLGRRLDIEPRILDLDWEVKGADEPYDSLQELYGRYRLGAVRFDVATIEVAALGVIAIDYSSKIQEGWCELAIFASPLADTSKISVGCRIIGSDQIERRRFEGDKFLWMKLETGQLRGTVSFRVPKAAITQVYASYAGTVLHQAWVADPTNSQNALRAAYTAFDQETTILSELVSKPPGRGNARELEAGVSWLLWMLGFRPAHLGNTNQLQEAPDILATSPAGHFVVVECTTGPLKTDSKLSLLIERAQRVRDSLKGSGNQHLKVLPVLVTSKRRWDVRADLDQAERLGVFVATAENLADGLSRTRVHADADQLFADAEKQVLAKVARYEAQGELAR